MGSYKSTYIGIYLEVSYGSENIPVTNYYHPVTGVKMNTKYCPKTGVECKESTSIVEKTIYPNPYIDEEGFEEDMFFSPEYSGSPKKTSTFILNVRNKYLIKNEEDVFNKSLEGIDINSLIKEFIVEYDSYIKYYKNLYPEVLVKFGVVSYAH